MRPRPCYCRAAAVTNLLPTIHCHGTSAHKVKLADGAEIPLSATADALADDLHRRYRESDAPRFDFDDCHQLCAMPVHWSLAFFCLEACQRVKASNVCRKLIPPLPVCLCMCVCARSTLSSGQGAAHEPRCRQRARGGAAGGRGALP